MATLKQRMRNGEHLTGTMLTVFDNPDIVRICKVIGFDYIIIDNEHGCIDYAKAAGMIGMARVIGLPCLVRLPDNRREAVLKYLEMGSDGFLLPNCDTAEQAAVLVGHAKYAPQGNRGVSMLRAHAGYEKVPSVVDYMREANENGVILCQIESSRAVEAVEDILAVDGVDAVFIGPNDLSQSYGLMGQFDHPTVVGAIDTVAAAAARAGKHSGIHIMGATADLKKWMAKGMTVNLWANEVIMMMNSGAAAIAHLRAPE